MMSRDFTKKQIVSITMHHFIDNVLADMNVFGVAASPATEELFSVDEAIQLLPEVRRKCFHSKVAQLLYLCKRVRPDMLTATVFLTTRVTKATEEDMSKLERLPKYLRGTKDLGLVLDGREGLGMLAWVDASYAAHPDAKGHNGTIMRIGKSLFLPSRK